MGILSEINAPGFLRNDILRRYFEGWTKEECGWSRKIIWEHGRRNFALRAEGVLAIVCPISDGSNVSGVGIFNATVEEVKKIMDEDPGVKAGVFIYEIHACRSFPGDSLPKE